MGLLDDLQWVEEIEFEARGELDAPDSPYVFKLYAMRGDYLWRVDVRRRADGVILGKGFEGITRNEALRKALAATREARVGPSD